MSFLYILADTANIYWTLTLKSTRFVPFGASLTQFEVNHRKKQLSVDIARQNNGEVNHLD